ncbi:S-adenosyl-L-methionine-dependent methyltransferase [Aspergillus multicolor]|uniref:tRNA (adenine-N(1)-)-methyltransferase n=1 Tax=Aspergillus multicolor TaxID=41759 RepID=UPI003CCCC6BC
MARLLRSLRNIFGESSSSSPAIAPPAIPRALPRSPRSIAPDFSRFQEGDRLIINNVKKRQPQLTAPLRRGHKIDTPKGKLDPEHIIGRGPREIVPTNKGTKFIVTLPTLEQYVSLTPRHVTPIYGKDAEVIVQLLDLHVAQPSEGDGSDGPAPLQILESGTGHGALTLHLSRAIQAANTLPPPIPKASQIEYLEQPPEQPSPSPSPSKETKPTRDPKAEPTPEQKQAAAEEQEAWNAYRATRKAILHTVEVHPHFSKHAEKLVRGFRRGLYAGNIEFYVGRVETWIAEQTKTKLEPFLTHAILDMPSAHLRIPHVAPVLKPDGILVVFMPSITQITECVKYIREQGIPLELDKCIELGTGISGGRTWDVRYAMKKSKADPGWDSANDLSSSEGTLEESVAVESEGEEAAVRASEAQTGETPKEEPVIVCRPLAGQRIGAGGFVGVWRKLQFSSASS